jgi:ribosomal protein L6P/L9E
MKNIIVGGGSKELVMQFIAAIRKQSRNQQAEMP